ncbi:MAG: hypothetical protein GQ565_13510 [Candidatus Aegiribacteria sp.]|nr:hypothetical protein [Candidatus Aegiribacteria sp.]
MDSSSKLKWNHQRLNNGCAWTCPATILGRWGIDIETEQLQELASSDKKERTNRILSVSRVKPFP